MLGKKLGAILLVFLLFSPSVLFGQDMMDGKWWQSKRVTEELKITDDEKSRLNDTYTASRRELITLKSNVEMVRFELDNLLDQRDAKKKDIVGQFDRLETARGSLSLERFNLLLGVREIVGIERYQLLKALHRMKRDKRTKRSNDKRRKGDD